MNEDINIGVITEALNNKVDLPNPTVPQDAVDYVVEKQDPTSANGYTWYRKYKSGWVEQGGFVSNLAWVGTGASKTITLPIVMNDSNYTVSATMGKNNTSWNYPGCRGYADSTTQITVGIATLGNNQGTVEKVYWQVSGYAA